MDENGRGEPTGEAGLRKDRLEPARSDKVRRRFLLERLQQRGPIEKPVTFERRAAEERGGESGRQAAKIIRRKQAQDAVALRRYQEGHGGGDEGRSRSMDRDGGAVLPSEGDQPPVFVLFARIRRHLRVLGFGEDDPVEIGHTRSDPLPANRLLKHCASGGLHATASFATTGRAGLFPPRMRSTGAPTG